MQVVAHIFAVSPFATLYSRPPQEGGEFQMRLAKFRAMVAFYWNGAGHRAFWTSTAIQTLAQDATQTHDGVGRSLHFYRVFPVA